MGHYAKFSPRPSVLPHPLVENIIFETDKTNVAILRLQNGKFKNQWVTLVSVSYTRGAAISDFPGLLEVLRVSTPRGDPDEVSDWYLRISDFKWNEPLDYPHGAHLRPVIYRTLMCEQLYPPSLCISVRGLRFIYAKCPPSWNVLPS